MNDSLRTLSLDMTGSLTSLSVHASSGMAVISCDDGNAYFWGGKKKFRKFQKFSLPPNCDYVTVSALYLTGLSATGKLFRRSLSRSSDWSPLLPDSSFSLPLSFISDSDLVVKSLPSGKSRRLNLKTETQTLFPLNCIQITDFDYISETNLVFVLNAENSAHRVFSHLFPEPLLKVASASGLIKWLCFTGCHFEKDVSAFQFALPSLMKLTGEKRQGSRLEKRGKSFALREFILLLEKEYKKGGVEKIGVVKLLEIYLKSAETSPQERRAALNLSQRFVAENELTPLCNS